MLEILDNIDAGILLFFNSMHLPFLDRFMTLFTGRFIWIPMYATIFFLLLRTYGARRVWIYAIGIGLAILATDQLCASYIRPMCERLRPSNPGNPLSAYVLLVNNYRGGPYGFPSCHSANSFALATFLSLLLRRRKVAVFIFGWAVLNSYTRLYLGVHYPGDLLTGALIGSTCGYLMLRVSRSADTLLQRRARSIGAHAAAAKDRSSRPVFTLPWPGPELAGIGRPTIAITAGDILISVGFLTALFIVLASII